MWVFAFWQNQSRRHVHEINAINKACTFDFISVNLQLIQIVKIVLRSSNSICTITEDNEK